MAKPFEMYVFDWDGTLMDTTRLIMQGYQHASKALGFPVPSDELVLSGSIVLIQSLYAAATVRKAAMLNLSKLIWIGMPKKKPSWSSSRASESFWKTCTKTANDLRSRPAKAEKG
jgi:phosphoglycolate phosphatase-like HAD superfamily hydrolase